MRGNEPEKDRSERYLLTYADLMNLLLILFIVLFCTATKDVVKTSAVMDAIAKSFNGPTSSASSSATGTTSSGTKTADYSEFYKQLYNLFKGNGMLDKVDITQSRDEVVITLKDNVLFAPGKDDLDGNATKLLTAMGGLLTKIKYGQMQIEGYTDSDPIHTAQFRDNVELSQKRAYNVYNVFRESGVDTRTMQPIGYGETKPIAANDTPENKAKNRRVVITIMGKGLTPSDATLTASQLLNEQIDAAKGASSAASSSSGKSSSSGVTSSSSAASSSSMAKK